MNAIHIQVLSGPTTGRSGVFVDAPITFGRAPTQSVVIDTPLASREHGELVVEGDRWCVVNRSSNGTTGNGKKIGDGPHALMSGDVVGVGKEKLFSVVIDEPTIETADGVQAPVEAAADDGEGVKKKKMLLWIVLSVWFLGVFGGLAALKQCEGEGDKGPNTPSVRWWSRGEIATEIGRLQSGSEVLIEAYEKSLKLAESAYEQRDYDTRALYTAHTHFKEALMYAKRDYFEDGLVQQKFVDCEKALIEAVVTRYELAYSQSQAGQRDEALRTLGDLQDIYPAYGGDSEFYDNVSAHQRVIRAGGR